MIEPTTFIAAVSLIISLIIAVFNIWRTNKTANKEDSSQLTTVIVKLENIGNDVSEIKTDLRDVKEDLKDHSERLVRVEQEIKVLNKTVFGKDEKA
jgi:peptidoglycan hydrolase CwlO-like protein